MALLEDQIEETQAAFIAAHEAEDKEGAQILADHLRDLEAQKAAVDQAAAESSQSQDSYKNPMITAGLGALTGAAAGPAKNQLSALVTKPSVPVEVSVSRPVPPMQPGVAPTNQNWTKALTGVDVPGAQMNKESLDTAQRMAATVGRGGPMAGGTITSGGIMLPPQIGVKPAAPAPIIPRNLEQAKEKGLGALRAIAGEHQPTRPFDIVKGGAKGAIAGGALGDIPEQVMRGNIGTTASDVGLGAGTILHDLAKTPKGRALAGLLALSSGITRAVQGVNELNQPIEQKADGGLIGNIASQAAYNAPYIVPTTASIGKNVAKGAYAPAIEDIASLGLALAPLNPLTAAMSMMAPREAGAGSTIDELNARKAAQEAARQRAQKQFEHEQFMREKVGANAPQFFQEYLVQQSLKKAMGGLIHLAEGGSPSAEEARRQLKEWLEKNKPTQPRTYTERLIDMGRDPSIPGSPIVKNTPTPKSGSGGAGFTPGTMNPFNPDSPLNR
jgi:hypothetical protein